MLERFADEARRAVSEAGEEAHRLGHDHVGTEHLLLGLIAQTGTTASTALTASGALLAPCRAKVREALASRTTNSPPGPADDLPFTDRASRALGRANRLSLHAGSETVLCEHILVSVLDVEGTAGQVLRGLAIDPDAVRKALENEQIVAVASSPMYEMGAKGHRGAAGPICGKCGSPLDSSLKSMELSLGSGKAARGVRVFYCSVCGTAIGTGT